jgi:transposase InsO family protein
MPFREMSIMSEREEFCRLAAMAGANRRELCRRAGISPQTGYKWLRRYEQEGLAGLLERSRRPLSPRLQTAPEAEAAVLRVRQEHPCWGGRKIRRVLQNQGLAQPPAASTITAILRRHGLLDGPGAGEARAFIRFEQERPNELWQMDFKGHVAMGQGRCHPLTVLDDHSRYALEIGALGDERGSSVRGRLHKVFERYGLPRRILADNGPPWGTAGSGAVHTPLTVWLLDLEIGVVHGRPYHPQTQGKEERFHRSLKAEALEGRRFENLQQAQQAFDAWREIYNGKRPHEGIGLAVPASRYSMSPRPMPEHIAPPEYEPGVPVRKVSAGGEISLFGRSFACAKAFAGRSVALRPSTTDGVFDLCYRRHVLAQLDLRPNDAITVNHVPEHLSTLSPV